MRKNLFILASSLLLLASCNSSNINIPKSPFNDSYNRIGMKSEYNYSLTNIDTKTYNEIKAKLEGDDDLGKVSSYDVRDEFRDLEYAYFGKESSSISQCRMTSKTENFKRYSNDVKISKTHTEDQIQTGNAGIVKTTSNINDFVFDTDWTEKESFIAPTTYNQNTQTNGVTVKVKEKVDYTGSTKEEKENPVYGLTPQKNIKSTHFISDVPIKLFGDNCIFGSFKNDNKDNYLIKEGASDFFDKLSKSGRTYKAVNNYFYEAILNEEYCITKFRFYTETLILSDAWDGGQIPILYLDKPELIKFTETKYNISYADREVYKGEIPAPKQS